MNLALFDFDGTITECDTFTPFIKKALPKYRRRIGQLLLLPSILAYRAGVLSGSAIRQQVVYVGLKGLSASRLTALGNRHAAEFLPSVIRANAMEQIT